MVESGFHRNDFFQLVLDRIDVFLFQDFGVDGRFIGIGGIYVPRTKYDIRQLCHGHDFAIVKILFVSTTSYANLVILSH